VLGRRFHRGAELLDFDGHPPATARALLGCLFKFRTDEIPISRASSMAGNSRRGWRNGRPRRARMQFYPGDEAAHRSDLGPRRSFIGAGIRFPRQGRFTRALCRHWVGRAVTADPSNPCRFFTQDGERRERGTPALAPIPPPSHYPNDRQTCRSIFSFFE